MAETVGPGVVSAAGAWQPAQPGPAPRSHRASFTSGPPFARRTLVLLIALLAIGAGIAAWLLWPSKFPALVLEAAASNRAGTDPCEGRQRCVVVLMAPWCRACKASFPLIRQLARRWSGSSVLGLKPVIGMGQRTRCEQMAEQLGVPSFVDPQARLARALGTKRVPTWVVVDAAGKIREQSPGAVLDTQLQIERLGLTKLDRSAGTAP